MQLKTKSFWEKSYVLYEIHFSFLWLDICWNNMGTVGDTMDLLLRPTTMLYTLGCLSIDEFGCATRCDDRAAELKIDLIQSQCDLSMDAARPAIAHVAISAFIHRAFIAPFVILYFYCREISVVSGSPLNTRHWTNADSMLDYLLRCWPSINFVQIGSASHIC